MAFSYNSDTALSNKEDTRPDLSVDVSGADLDDDDTTNSQTLRVSKEDIWKEMVKSSYGRDKTLKLIQYAMKVYVLFHVGFSSRYASAKGSTSPRWERSLIRRLDSTMSGLSLSRRCLLLFNWLAPLTVIQARQSVPYSSESATTPSHKRKTKPLLYTLLHTSPPVLLELLNGAADDVYTFSRLGLLGNKTGDAAGKFADWCWFANTLVNLVENTVERGILRDLQHEVEGRSYTESMTLGATAKSNPAASQIDEHELSRLHKRDYWLVMTRNKLLMDLIFVSYNCFGLKRAKAPVQAFTGLTSAVLSTAKLYNNENNRLAKPTKS